MTDAKSAPATPQPTEEDLEKARDAWCDHTALAPSEEDVEWLARFRAEAKAEGYRAGIEAAARWHEKQSRMWTDIGNEYISMSDQEQAAYKAGAEALGKVHVSYAESLRALLTEPSGVAK